MPSVVKSLLVIIVICVTQLSVCEIFHLSSSIAQNSLPPHPGETTPTDFRITSVRESKTEVPWLSQVMVSSGQGQDSFPQSMLENIGKMEPVFAVATDSQRSHVDQWLERREDLRRIWRDFLGPMPDTGTPVKPEIVRRDVFPEVIRELVQYDGEPGSRVEGYLLRPVTEERHRRFPAIVALHQTTDSSIDEVAGVSGPDAMQIGWKLAHRGFIVFCPRCFLWENGNDLNAAVARHRERHPKTTGMAKMLYDATRAVDLLTERSDVDSTRIGAVGHSLGAKEVLYLSAFDDRIQVSVASEGGIGLRSTNWDAPWYLGNAIRDADFARNHHELIAMTAPRPLLIIGGESGPGAADGERSRPLLQAALPAWSAYGEPIRLGLLNHGQGHTISEETFHRMAEWLEIYLTKKAD
ncbi:MAG: alpha/beta hydrolase family protein [Planctomyces sp.]